MNRTIYYLLRFFGWQPPMDKLSKAIIHNDLEQVKRLFNKDIATSYPPYQYTSHLASAVGLNRIEIVEYMINNGADITGFHGTRLFYLAKMFNNKEMVDLLLKAGVQEEYPE